MFHFEFILRITAVTSVKYTNLLTYLITNVYNMQTYGILSIQTFYFRTGDSKPCYLINTSSKGEYLYNKHSSPLAEHEVLDHCPFSKHVIILLSVSYPVSHVTVATAPNVVLFSSSSMYFPFNKVDTFPQSRKHTKL